jgi:hypothetical protein
MLSHDDKFIVLVDKPDTSQTLLGLSFVPRRSMRFPGMSLFPPVATEFRFRTPMGHLDFEMHPPL